MNNIVSPQSLGVIWAMFINYIISLPTFGFLWEDMKKSVVIVNEWGKKPRLSSVRGCYSPGRARNMEAIEEPGYDLCIPRMNRREDASDLRLQLLELIWCMDHKLTLMCDLIFCVFTPLIRRYIVRYDHCSWQALSHHGLSKYNIWNLSKGTLTVFFIEEKLCIVIYNNYRTTNTLCKDFFVLVHIKDLNESCIKINVGLGIIQF